MITLPMDSVFVHVVEVSCSLEHKWNITCNRRGVLGQGSRNVEN